MSNILSKHLPLSLDLRIIGACNLRCPFCFGPRHEIGSIDVTRFIKLLPDLRHLGVKNVVITGGEPLLVAELSDLLRALKEFKISTVLSTNGLLLNHQLNMIAPYLDWISLPLDADKPDINQVMRYTDPNSFATTLNLIERIRLEFPFLKIKIGTVVCKINRDHVVGIPRLLEGIRKPDIWKLYQISYSSYGEDNKELLQLTDTEFENIALLTKKEAAIAGLSMAFYRNQDRSGKYLFCEPNGDAMVIDREKEVIIGNFFEDLDNILQEWQRYIDPNRLWENVLNTYPGVQDV